jgi:hypothetical protein
VKGPIHSPFATKSDEYECRNVCQPMFLLDSGSSRRRLNDFQQQDVRPKWIFPLSKPATRLVSTLNYEKNIPGVNVFGTSPRDDMAYGD